MTTDYRTNNKVCRGMALGHDDKGQEEHIGGFSNPFFHLDTILLKYSET